MATAMMGLRRRAPTNTSPSPAVLSPPSTSNKRSRSENNNSPSHGNLNSLTASQNEPPAKKSRGTSTAGSKNACLTDISSHSTKSRGSTSKAKGTSTVDGMSKNAMLSSSPWPGTSSMNETASYASVAPLNMSTNQTTMCSGSLNMSTTMSATPIPYMATSMATFVGNATNLSKNNGVSYLDISNMTSGGLNSSPAVLSSSFLSAKTSPTKPGLPIPFSGSGTVNGSSFKVSQAGEGCNQAASVPKKFQNDAMFSAYQPWVIKTYGDLAKTKTITIKKYARILRTLRGEEANSAENSKFRFWVKSKGFHIGQPEGYDAKPADKIIGRHAVTSPGLDPPLYVPTQPPHNKALNGAEGTVPPGRVHKKVAIVENFFDIIHAVHVDLEGRPGKHAGQKRTYRTITETYAFLPREAVTRFLLGCTECQRRPRTPSPTNLTNQPQPPPLTSSATPPSPTPATTLSASPLQTAQKPKEACHAPESKTLFNYRHPKHQKLPVDKLEKENAPKDREEKYNPLSITNLLKKDPPPSFPSTPDNPNESRRTPESDRASSRSSASSKRRRMLPEGRTPSPQPSLPLPRPWSPGIDPKNTPIDYSLPITTTYLKHQQRILAEKSKASQAVELDQMTSGVQEADALERERFSPAAGLIDTNLNLLATIQQLHCQVMLALTERLRPSAMPTSLVLPQTSSILLSPVIKSEISVPAGMHPKHS